MSNALVEMVDLFPTLVDMASLPALPLCPPSGVGTNTSVNAPSLCTEGYSFRDAIETPSWKGKAAAFSQYPRPSDTPQNTSDLPDCNSISRMGYSIRTDAYRYTEWVDFECIQPKSGAIQSSANWSLVRAKELYDVTTDRVEAINLAYVPNLATLVANLSMQLRAGWRVRH